MLRVTARQMLSSGKFRHGGIFVEEGRWSNVDPNDKDVRATLLAYVPSHVRLAHGQDRELAAAELKLEGGRLIDLRPPAEEKTPGKSKATARTEKT